MPAIGKGRPALKRPGAGEGEADFAESRADRPFGSLGRIGFFMNRADCRPEIGTGPPIRLQSPRSVDPF